MDFWDNNVLTYAMCTEINLLTALSYEKSTARTCVKICLILPYPVRHLKLIAAAAN